MPKLNRIERHPARLEIERLLAAKEKLRVIGERYDLPVDVLWRHKAKLERRSPGYFGALKPAEVTPDAQKLLAALAEIADAIRRATEILCTT